MPEGLRVLDAAARKFGLDLHFDHFDFSSWDDYERHGRMPPRTGKDPIGGHDAIYFDTSGDGLEPRSRVPLGLPAAVSPSV